MSQQKTGIDYTKSLAHLTREGCLFIIPVIPNDLRCQYEKSATILRPEELYQCLQTTKLLGDTATINYIQNILSAEN